MRNDVKQEPPPASVAAAAKGAVADGTCTSLGVCSSLLGGDPAASVEVVHLAFGVLSEHSHPWGTQLVFPGVCEGSWWLSPWARAGSSPRHSACCCCTGTVSLLKMDLEEKAPSLVFYKQFLCCEEQVFGVITVGAQTTGDSPGQILSLLLMAS